jgi:hypothetical protein
MSLMMENLKFAKGIDPVANAFASTVRSDVYSMRDHGRILFVIYAGVGATGTTVVTVSACDDVVPTTRVAIPFWSREILTGDTDGAITRRAAAGFTTTAGSSKIILIEADAKDCSNAQTTTNPSLGFIELTCAESVASAVLGGIHVVLGRSPARYSRGAANATVIV